ncbi:ATP-binding protein [Tunturiibacter lichenicola]|uniref:ATP-binding protein n=1 Tax=Tunturiibacter lichenicola TaxID=2051959 RepID=UPI0021B3C267|nr:ATP-binding protein [Edaphobacter lichenicola]
MDNYSVEKLQPPVATTADEVRATIESCEDEPIRIPGSIQRHGFFLLLDEPNELVIAASENAEEFLQVPLKLILGARLETVLEREVLAVIRALSPTTETAGQISYLGSFPLRKELCSVVTHLVGGQRVLEFERVDRLVSSDLMNGVVTNFVAKLGSLKSEMALCQAITSQVKNLTGFNRVLLYQFDEDGHGTVLTEENDGVLPNYLDLRFPASDIPKQARELYISNTIRIIPNASYVPSPLRGITGQEMRSFNLASSILRSVSPIHLEYMRNMGTMSSMSISILFEGRLWGLISCHHAEPRSVSYVIRSACDLLTKMVSTQLLAFRSAHQLESAMHFHAIQRSLLTQMAAENNHIAALVSHIGELPQVTNAQGAALIIEGKVFLGGLTPTESDVLRLTHWMDAHPHLDIFQTNNLCSDFDWAEGMRSIASGWLVVRISDVRQSYLMWFRPEVVSTVKWAGQPVKIRDQQRGLHPRDSFESWQGLVHGKSDPWTGMEVESALDFRTAVITISLKRAEEAIELSEARFKELTQSLPNLVWVVNDDGKLGYVNDKWRQEELADEGLWFEQRRLSFEDRETCRQRWEKAVKNGSFFEIELRLQGKLETSDHWYLVRAVPFLKADKSRAGWVGTFTDLTERREREIAIKITEKLALTGRMTSVIAHEINNPLEAVTNIHYLLGQEVRDNAAARKYVAMAEYEIERISGITKQTLRWSKENAQDPEYCSAATLFDDVLRLFKGKTASRNISVFTSGGESEFFGIAGQVRQVLTNLISNAIDAVSVGGSIWLSATEQGSGTQIAVRDNGQGMNEETRRQLFQPFNSTKGDLGNGLGLYISHEIVERHGGKISVETVEGHGTHMKLFFPAALDLKMS